MKKILSLILAASLLLGCAAFAEEEYAELQTGYYIFENNTGEKIMSVTITDNKNPENWFKASRENGFDPGETIAMGFSIPAEDKDTEHRLTLLFTTASGQTWDFTTLAIEEATICLLAEDARTGATPIRFKLPGE